MGLFDRLRRQPLPPPPVKVERQRAPGGPPSAPVNTSPAVAVAVDPAASIVTLSAGSSVVEVLGEASYQNNLYMAAGGWSDRNQHHHRTWAVLVPEPTNPYDANAVQVQVNGLVVGYLSRANAPKYSQHLRATWEAGHVTVCAAFIMGGWYDERDGSTGNFGIRLELDAPSRCVPKT